MYESTRREAHSSDKRVAAMPSTGLRDFARAKQAGSALSDSDETPVTPRCLFCRYRSPGAGKELAHV
ncbi:hypothetical protein HMPREF9710_04830 [Massilia timonae CCUG 45783]|uniref:Uncharacterized protein n=1 Tax=Massilia timonae CCUG 45783 TaxID=883126 RepID=K9DMJ3_9BURK|nr:hypothetical protein HMPREF9710_04830 [Massilia timonae CCUG 45783]